MLSLNRALEDFPEAAVEMCVKVANTAFNHFGDVEEAVRVLRSWKLTDCRALGRSLFALIEQDLIEPTDRVRPEDFSNAPLGSLFPPPQRG